MMPRKLTQSTKQIRNYINKVFPLVKYVLIEIIQSRVAELQHFDAAPAPTLLQYLPSQLFSNKQKLT
jgi:hypothetical protein